MGKRLKRAKEKVDPLSPKEDTTDESLDDLECHMHLLEKKVAFLEEKNTKQLPQHKCLIVILQPEI